MNPEFPYVARLEMEKYIDDVLKRVRSKGSEAILMYGNGGVGKTSYLRNLIQRKLEGVIWLGPFDVDDAQFWLLPQIAREIISMLGKKYQGYFGAYLQFLAEVPDFEREKIGHETALTKLREGDKIFFDCYAKFIIETQQTMVLIFDTVEAIRGLDILGRLISWIKLLPGTLVILAERPPAGSDDSIIEQLDEEPRLSFTQIHLAKFSDEESRLYLEKCVGQDIDANSIGKLVSLCDGSPLLLALAVDQLSKENLPKKLISGQGATEDYLSKKKKPEREEFLRFLMSQFRASEFWPEVIKRLGVVRHRLDKKTWIKLMSDRSLPEGIETWDDAWEELLRYPWIRKRSNGKEITLHDVLAEQLAKWVIPLDDRDGTWLLHLWQNAASIYDQPIQESISAIERESLEFERLAHAATAEKSAPLLQKAIALDIRVIEYYLLNIAQLYYSLLSDFDSGIKRFVEAFDRAYPKHEYRYIELLWAELQRFLPESKSYDPLQDVIKRRVDEFRKEYRKSKEYRYKIGSRIAKYFIDFEKTQPAVEWLTELLVVCKGDSEKEYELYKLRANGYLRTPHKAGDAGQDFQKAYKKTQNKKATAWLKSKEGEALMELGFYYRNVGDWRKAGESYSKAIDAIPYNDPRERARVQSQYAYVQALLGDYDRASKQIEASLMIRRKTKDQRGVGMALSVQGEVYRYMQRYQKSWSSYSEAEQIFTELDIPGWLGLVKQEMAICLVRAQDANVRVGRWQSPEQIMTANVKQEMLFEARELAMDAVELCRMHSSRGLPSALNRAGRILARTGDVDNGLEMMLEGEQRAERVTDQWFQFANLVEYVELCYKIWQEGGRRDIKYRSLLDVQREKLEKVRNELNFPNLQGRWDVMKGHLLAEDGLALNDPKKARMKYDEALGQYKNGYVLIVTGYAASQGILGLSRQMTSLRSLVDRLSEDEREHWFKELIETWRMWKNEGDRALLDPLFAEIAEIQTDYLKI